MRLMFLIAATGLVAAALLGGCASNDGLGLTTASLTPQKTAAKPTVDPECVTLAAKINEARAEGTPGRVADVAAAQNKPRIVNIKRASLAKVTELDAMNKEFQARCSTVPTQSASAPAPANPAASAATKAVESAAANAASATASKVATSATAAAKQKAQTAVASAASRSILTPPKTR